MRCFWAGDISLLDNLPLDELDSKSFNFWIPSRGYLNKLLTSYKCMSMNHYHIE